jgi:hypothetical protein
MLQKWEQTPQWGQEEVKKNVYHQENPRETERAGKNYLNNLYGYGKGKAVPVLI